jgi:hypothetical protein
MATWLLGCFHFSNHTISLIFISPATVEKFTKVLVLLIKQQIHYGLLKRVDQT